jgi:cytochrome c oxidase subunit IV
MSTEHGSSSGHGASLGVYFAIFFVLLVLTGVTVAVAFQDLGPLNTPIALGIAGFKAFLVGTWFMHLRYSRRLTWVFAIGSLLWLALMISFTITDFISRDWM